MADNMKVTPSVALPVILSYFDCEDGTNAATLKWQAVEETNLENYILEYSRDGMSFSTLAKISPGGANQVYQFVHYNVSGTAWYRLKMVEQDGSYKYSETRKLLLKSNTDLTIIPNPANDRFYIYSKNAPGIKTIAIISPDGTVVKTINSYNDGQPISIADLPKGSYLIKVNSKAQVWSRRLIKM